MGGREHIAAAAAAADITVIRIAAVAHRRSLARSRTTTKMEMHRQHLLVNDQNTSPRSTPMMLASSPFQAKTCRSIAVRFVGGARGRHRPFLMNSVGGGNGGGDGGDSKDDTNNGGGGRDDNVAPPPPPPAQSRGRALRELERIDRALKLEVKLPYVPFFSLSADSAIGKLPGAGFLLHLGIGCFTLHTAHRYGASPALLTRMAANM